LPELDDLDDIGVAESSCYLRFALEAADDEVDALELWMKQLERDDCARGKLLGLEHPTHSAFADYLEQPIPISDAGSEQRRGICG
jgi:hypothetical protein